MFWDMDELGLESVISPYNAPSNLNEAARLEIAWAISPFMLVFHVKLSSANSTDGSVVKHSGDISVL